MTNKEIIEKCIECEHEGKFDVHTTPINYDIVIPLTADFPYINHGWRKIKVFFQKVFAIKPFVWYENKLVYKTKVEGRENLKGVKSAIVTSSHVFIFDCLIAMHALRGHKLKITAADFNNQEGWFGDLMRAGGMLPIGKKIDVMKKFNNAVEHYLLYNNFILFYPEQAMWYMYDKPRPRKDGAFHYAAKFNVPVIPMFISYRNSGKIGKDGLEIKYITEHILKPIFPDPKLSFKENEEMLKGKEFEAVKEKYEEVYGKKLIYDIKENTEEIQKSSDETTAEI